jgi:ribonuclease-3
MINNIDTQNNSSINTNIDRKKSIKAQFYNPNNKLVTKKIIYKFLRKGEVTTRIRDFSLWQQAFVHKSYSVENKRLAIDYDLETENKDKNNDEIELKEATLEQLEFLGDGTRTRSRLVKTEGLAKLTKFLGLQEYMILTAHEEQNNNGRTNAKHLEDLFESFVGCLYYDLSKDKEDRGKAYTTVQKFVRNIIEQARDFTEIMEDTNYKGQLMRYYQKVFSGKTPLYFDDVKRAERNKERDGDQRKFYIFILHPETKRVVGKGFGKSKKEAAQYAAKIALQNLGVGDAMAVV